MALTRAAWNATVDFLAEHTVEEIEIGRLAAGRVIQYGIEALGHVAEPQTGELLDDTTVDDGAHWSPPATMAA